MNGTRYAIPDEPSPSRFEHLIVDPMWPLFALMFGGLWLALPWFVFNGLALGSPSRLREWLALAIALLGSTALVLVIAHGHAQGWLGGVRTDLALVTVVMLKLGMGFWAYGLQGRSFELWQHFGGNPRNGVLIVVAGFFAEPHVLAVSGHGLVRLVLE